MKVYQIIILVAAATLVAWVLSGCASQDPMFACKPPSISIHHYAWGDTCFWPEAPRPPTGM